MDKFLVKPNKEKNKENMQMMNMKNEMKDIPSNHKDLKRIIGDIMDNFMSTI